MEIHLSKKDKISKESDIIFTNPDTIHASILPNHSFNNWKEFLGALKFVVMDELHVYKGTLGSMLALLWDDYQE